MIRPAPARNTHPLGLAAQALFRANPSVYEDFINRLQSYSSELALAVTTAPADQIFVVQGRSQQAQEFLRLLEEVDRR